MAILKKVKESKNEKIIELLYFFRKIRANTKQKGWARAKELQEGLERRMRKSWFKYSHAKCKLKGPSHFY